MLKMCNIINVLVVSVLLTSAISLAGRLQSGHQTLADYHQRQQYQGIQNQQQSQRRPQYQQQQQYQRPQQYNRQNSVQSRSNVGYSFNNPFGISPYKQVNRFVNAVAAKYVSAVSSSNSYSPRRSHVSNQFSGRYTNPGKSNLAYKPKPQNLGNAVRGGYTYPSPTKTPSYTVSGYAVREEPLDSQRISQTECLRSNQGTFSNAFLFGGVATATGEFPYMAGIGWKQPSGGYNYLCGGTLISSNFVLTAAHCIRGRNKAPDVALVGGHTLDDPAVANKNMEISRVHVHPEYKRKQVYNDIALLNLKGSALEIPACLWPDRELNFRASTALGYGQTGFGASSSNALLKADLQFIATEVCSPLYTPRFRLEMGLIDSQFCAGDLSRQRDTCPGDSGGPLIKKSTINGKQVSYVLGITSFGQGCGGGPPGIYTRVSSYLDWIEPIVWPQVRNK